MKKPQSRVPSKPTKATNASDQSLPSGKSSATAVLPGRATPIKLDAPPQKDVPSPQVLATSRATGQAAAAPSSESSSPVREANDLLGKTFHAAARHIEKFIEIVLIVGHVRDGHYRSLDSLTAASPNGIWIDHGVALDQLRQAVFQINDALGLIGLVTVDRAPVSKGQELAWLTQPCTSTDGNWERIAQEVLCIGRAIMERRGLYCKAATHDGIPVLDVPVPDIDWARAIVSKLDDLGIEVSISVPSKGAERDLAGLPGDQIAMVWKAIRKLGTHASANEILRVASVKRTVGLKIIARIRARF
jgi:hypothetical protein